MNLLRTIEISCGQYFSKERLLSPVDCPSKKWGPYCDKDCPECLNGGMCHDVDGDCMCPPGFMGMRCETGLNCFNSSSQIYLYMSECVCVCVCVCVYRRRHA